MGHALSEHSEDTKATEASWFSVRSVRNLGVVFLSIYLVALIIFCLAYRVFPGPELLFVVFFIYAASRKWSRRFARDWVPFVGLFLGYEAMYGIVDNLAGVVHVKELIGAESHIFGNIPTLVLQQFYRNPMIDYVGAFFYSLHFIVPTVFGFILWKYSPKNYWKYTFAFLFCSYSALLTFLLYPCAPPWFGVSASRILYQVDAQMGVPLYRMINNFIQPNPFAAFPSLHATYPWLISLFALKIKRIRALPILVLPIGVWFSAVYLGEHYVIDILGGIAYASSSFFLVEKVVPRLQSNALMNSFGLKLKLGRKSLYPDWFGISKFRCTLPDLSRFTSLAVLFRQT